MIGGRPGLARLIVGSVLIVLAGGSMLVLAGHLIGAEVGSEDPHGFVIIFSVGAVAALLIPLLAGVALVVSGRRARRTRWADAGGLRVNQ